MASLGDIVEFKDGFIHGNIPAYVAEELKREGYEIATSYGMRVYAPEKDAIGILGPEIQRTRKFLGIIPISKLERDYVANLYLNNPSLEAKEDKIWILDVYGDNNLKNLQKITEGIATIIGNIGLHTRLESREPKKEEFFPDGYN